MASMNQVGNHRTMIMSEGGLTVVRYHSTNVVSFNDLFVTLNSGGWQSKTTKDRMTQASNQFDLGYSVTQKAFRWFVSFKGKVYRFEDGMVLNRQTGVVLGKDNNILPEAEL